MNKYRVGKNVIKKNFGMILIDWSSKRPSITFEVWGSDKEPYMATKAF
jgi:hypothetical protein